MRTVESRVERLIEDIYAAGLCDQPWEAVLHGIRAHSGSRFVSMFTFDATGAAALQRFAGDDPGSEEKLANDYIADFHAHDTGRPVVSTWAAGRWYDDREWVRSAQRAQSIFHQEYLRPFGFGRVEGSFVHRTPHEGHFLSLLGPLDRPNDPSYRTCLAGLAPHLARALRMQSHLERLAASEALGEAAFNALTMPIFVLDEQRRLLKTNAAGQGLMAAEPALRFIHGRFEPPCASARQWAAWCERGMLVLPSSSAAGRPLVLNLIPVSARAQLSKEWQRPLTMMMPADVRTAADRKRRLSLIYGLTQAEAEVCASICDGGLSPQECAQARGVSIGTIRSQIKAIHLKVGVTRLSDLVRIAGSI